MKKLAYISGHQGPGTGAASSYLDEGSETIEFKAELTYQSCTNYNIVPLEDGDFKSLKGVIARFKRVLTPTDLLLSIHFNSSSNTAVSGTEVIIPNDYTYAEMEYAKNLASIVSSTLKIRNRGVKFEKDTAHKRIGILRGPKAVNILLEICFLSNKKDVESYRKNKITLARKIAELNYKYLKED